MRPFWLPALLAPLLMALEVSMDLSQPRLLQSIIDTGIARHDLAFVLHTGLRMVLVACIGFIGGAGCTVFATIASLNFAAVVRDRVFQSIQRLSFGNLDRLQTGGLITRITNDVDQVQDASLMMLRILVRAPLLAIGSLIMAAITAPRLSLLLVLIGPLIVALLLAANRKAHPLFTQVQNRLDRVNTVVQEALSGVRVVKAFVREDHERAQFGDASTALCDQTVRAAAVMAGVMPIMMLLLNSGIIAALWFGGIGVSHGTMRVGALLAFINYLAQMLSSLMMVGMLLMRVVRADASAERILEVLDSTPDVQDTPDASSVPALRGEVAFDGVGFSYGTDGGSPVLQDVSFTVQPGQTVAILGATGSGKTTLVHLLARLYDVTEGRILVDGHDLRSLTQETLRRNIAVALQETMLFSGTIRDNLRYGREDATDAEMVEAARIAHAHDFIITLPDGYSTVLGQGGLGLSGGQRQRLAIARALVARPAILILDDCTSAVDMGTEASIVAALNSWEHQCTRFVIAQRIGAVTGADLILVLDGGSVAAMGDHQTLLQTSPLYRDIVRSQLSDEEVTLVRQ